MDFAGGILRKIKRPLHFSILMKVQGMVQEVFVDMRVAYKRYRVVLQLLWKEVQKPSAV